MTLREIIQEAIKSKNIIVGYRRSIKFLKLYKPKLIIVAENTPEKIINEIKHNSKFSSVEIKTFEGSSKELGIICGKPFPVTTLVIKG